MQMLAFNAIQYNQPDSLIVAHAKAIAYQILSLLRRKGKLFTFLKLFL